jgi:hypothetical protein
VNTSHAASAECDLIADQNRTADCPAERLLEEGILPDCWLVCMMVEIRQFDEVSA